MEKFVILAMKRQGSEVEALKEIYANEEGAIRYCIQVFRFCGMQKVILVDSKINVRFKDTRICKCLNVQQEMVGMESGNIVYRNTCVSCGVVIDPDAWMTNIGVEVNLEETEK